MLKNVKIMVVFVPIFMTDTKVVFGYNFRANMFEIA